MTAAQLAKYATERSVILMKSKVKNTLWANLYDYSSGT
jgi:hypothetical protein